MRAKRLVSALFSSRGLFWLIWLWVLGYVTASVWVGEAFGRFMILLEQSLPVQAGAFFFVSIALVAFIRFVLRGYGSRGPVFTLWAVFPAGALVFLIGFTLAGVFGQRELGLTRQGDIINLRWGAVFRVSELVVDMEEKKILADEPVGLLRSEPEAVLQTIGGRTCTVRAFPPAYCMGTYANIRDYGMAPGLVLYERGDQVHRGHVNLRILPPGNEDFIQIEGLPYRIYVRIVPQMIRETESGPVRVYDLGTPLYSVRVEKAGQVLFEGTSEERISFDRFEISFTPYQTWVWLVLSKGIGLPVLAAGLAIMVVGLPISILLALYRIYSGRREAREG